ncbi:protein kinase domain-containing protein [Ditylenchus destructor]|uniref:non-specific serine/threonine protein kinase n=1 Tax=Ditylenchus destructor TaxID=166010 RepID=A0AAD4N9D7_9BILA|nr:protein kinase domain-containing protein [Ditylenchus destructor]
MTSTIGDCESLPTTSHHFQSTNLANSPNFAPNQARQINGTFCMPPHPIQHNFSGNQNGGQMLQSQQSLMYSSRSNAISNIACHPSFVMPHIQLPPYAMSPNQTNANFTPCMIGSGPVAPFAFNSNVPPPPLPTPIYHQAAPSVVIAQPINIKLEVKPPVSWQHNITQSQPQYQPAIIKILPSSTIEIDCWNTAVTGWEQATLIKNKIGLVINKRYKIVQSIASGSYGAIFVAEDLQSPTRSRVAVKFDAACKDDHLKYEFEVYKSVLYEDGNGRVEGFPKVYWYGHEYGHNIMVMELLGAPLASLFAFCDRKFGKQTIVSLGEQMIQRIKHLHQRGFIHRDIKPENFLIGLGDKESTCYLIDFGLARRYRYRENRLLRHIPFRKGRNFVGTAKYASVNSHKSIELSRRDDLESLGYVLIELINGSVPWKNISKRTAITRQQTSIRIRNVKEQTNWAETCPSMTAFIKYCRELPFADDPDYDVLLGYLRAIVVPTDPTHSGSSLTSITPIQLKCDSCVAYAANHQAKKCESPTDVPDAPASKEITNTDSTTVIPNQHLAFTPDVIQPDNVAPETNNISSGDIICQIPYTFIPTVISCDEAINTLAIIDDHPPIPTMPDCHANEGSSLIAPTKSLLQAEETEESISGSTASCKNCRERLQLYFDQQQKSQRSNVSTSPKMSWQIWRESTMERGFQYDNRFSWTVPAGRSRANSGGVQQTPQTQVPLASPPVLVMPSHMNIPPPPYMVSHNPHMSVVQPPTYQPIVRYMN